MTTGKPDWYIIPNDVDSDAKLHPECQNQENDRSSSSLRQERISDEFGSVECEIQSQQTCESSVVYLADKFVLCKILPKCYSVFWPKQMIWVVEPVAADPRECVAWRARTCSSCEEASDKNKRQENFGCFTQDLSIGIVSCDFLEICYNSLLRSPQYVEGLPETHGV